MWSCNLGLALGMAFKFYTSVAKVLKLKLRKFWRLILNPNTTIHSLEFSKSPNKKINKTRQRTLRLVLYNYDSCHLLDISNKKTIHHQSSNFLELKSING